MAGGLCEPCLEALNRLAKLESIKVSPFQVRALLTWMPGKSDLLSRLVLSLKKGSAQANWNYYAEIFSRNFAHELLGGRTIVIVPAPSRHPGKKDHAYRWGMALAQALGAEFYPHLKRNSDQHQRGADRGERALIEMHLDENYTGTCRLSADPIWVFVDDVLTTGATARAAHKALGYPQNFEVWVFAHRSLSCGASKDLL